MSYSINFSTKVFTSVTAAFSFISVGIPCEFAMVPDVYILLQTHLKVLIKKILTFKYACEIIALSLVLLVDF